MLTYFCVFSVLLGVLSLTSGWRRFARAVADCHRTTPAFCKAAKVCSKNFVERIILQNIASGKRILRHNAVLYTSAFRKQAKQWRAPSSRLYLLVPPYSEISRYSVIEEHPASAEQPNGAHPDTTEYQTSCADAQNLSEDREKRSELFPDRHESDQQYVIREKTPTPSPKTREKDRWITFESSKMERLGS